MNFVYKITFIDLINAMKIADLRIYESIRQNKHDPLTAKMGILKTTEFEIVGVLGEIAACKYLNIDSPLINGFKKFSDVGTLTEIRSTTKPEGCLIIRDRDDKNKNYVLATVTRYEVTLHGWINGTLAKQPEFQRNPHNLGTSYFIPQDQLQPINTLPHVDA